MADLFFDSSGLVKRYVSETGSAWVTKTVDTASGNNIFIAEVTAVEITAAIARRTRGETAAAINRVFANLQHDLAVEYFDLQVNSTIFRAASILARKHFLKGYDAVQLAVAIEFNRAQTALGLPTITLVSADTELLDAAKLEGLNIENPNNYP